MHGDIYIFGGHKLAFSYYQKLERAKASHEFESHTLFCISDDPTDLVHLELSQKNRIESTPSAFLIRCATGEQKWKPGDIVIPDHTAKHILLMAYRDLTCKILPNAKVELTPLELDLETPFLHKSENGAIWAMSYATWMCPPECDEPDICPHIQGARTWDFFETLEKERLSLVANRQSPGTLLFYRYGCTPIHAEISHIPLKGIVNDMRDYVKKLQAGLRPDVVVATHSRCHGIVGRFKVLI